MAGRLKVVLENQRDELQRISTALEEFSNVESIPADVIMQLELCIEELFLNIISYAWDDQDKHEIEILVGYDDVNVSVDIFDDGSQFNPLEEAPSQTDMEKPVEEIEIGGHGLALVRNLVDTMSYRYENGRNHLSLAKRIN